MTKSFALFLYPSMVYFPICNHFYNMSLFYPHNKGVTYIIKNLNKYRI